MLRESSRQGNAGESRCEATESVWELGAGEKLLPVAWKPCWGEQCWVGERSGLMCVFKWPSNSCAEDREKKEQLGSYHRGLGQGVQKLQPVGQIWPTGFSCIAHELRMEDIKVLNGWEKNQRRTAFCDISKVYKTQISGSINKILLEHRHDCPLVPCLWPLSSSHSRAE